jgi:DNA-binding MarR family transcriptional regulator
MEKEKEEIIQKINQMGFFISQNIDQKKLSYWTDLDLTMNQLKSLLFIEFRENVCIRDLSQILKMAQPNVTNLVDFLVKEGLVSRDENPEDRRMLVLKTTPTAKKLITDLRDSISTEISVYLGQLSLEQLQALTVGLNPVVKLMQEGQSQISLKEQ